MCCWLEPVQVCTLTQGEILPAPLPPQAGTAALQTGQGGHPIPG